MPSSLPSRSTRRPVDRASSLALPPVLSIGITPTPLKNIRLNQPLIPLPVK